MLLPLTDRSLAYLISTIICFDLFDFSSVHISIIGMPDVFSTHPSYGNLQNFWTIDMVIEILQFYIFDYRHRFSIIDFDCMVKHQQCYDNVSINHKKYMFNFQKVNIIRNVQ